MQLILILALGIIFGLIHGPSVGLLVALIALPVAAVAELLFSI